MRIVFCGSGAFAVPSLRAIAQAGHELVRVITQPARPAGRGGRLRATAVAEAAAADGMSPVELADINAPDAVEMLSADQPDLLCVVDFGQFIRQAARETARLGAVNLHGSLLPALRGAAPANWAIIRGLTTTGVTVFSLVDAMDAGPIYVQKSLAIGRDETADQLRGRLAEMGAEAMCETIGALEAGPPVPEEQDHSQATKAPRLTKADGVIDWAADAETVRNLIHGTWPWPGGHGIFEAGAGKALPVQIARVVVEDAQPPGREPGQLDENLCVATGSGRIRILQIKPAGKRMMTWRDFVNGYRVSDSNRFVQSPT